MQYMKGDWFLAFSLGLFCNFLLLSFQTKVNIKRKILELLSACGKMKKEKAQLSRFWQNNQWIKHCFCAWQVPTSLGLQSGLLWDMHKNIQVVIYKLQYCNSQNPLLLNLYCRWIVTSAECQLLSAKSPCLALVCPILDMPKSAASGKPKHEQHWPRQLLSLAASRGKRQSHNWRNWEVSARHCPHPHSAEASLFKLTSHHQHMEGLQGFASWVTDRFDSPSVI